MIINLARTNEGRAVAMSFHIRPIRESGAAAARRILVALRFGQSLSFRRTSFFSVGRFRCGDGRADFGRRGRRRWLRGRRRAVGVSTGRFPSHGRQRSPIRGGSSRGISYQLKPGVGGGGPVCLRQSHAVLEPNAHPLERWRKNCRRSRLRLARFFLHMFFRRPATSQSDIHRTHRFHVNADG